MNLLNYFYVSPQGIQTYSGGLQAKVFLECDASSTGVFMNAVESVMKLNI